VAFGGVNVGIDQLVVMGVALGSMVGLTYLFRSSRLGRGMRAVVDNGELLSLTGASPTAVRRSAWYIGTAFAALSGVLLAPTIGLDATILTLLVVQAFGAAAIGLFRSIPATYAGGLAIGVVAALSTKYVASVPALAGLPSSLPFIVLFAILLVVPRRWLVDVASERQRRVRERRPTSRVALASRALTVVVLSIAVPGLAGTRLSIYTAALAYVILFLSLALLVRTSGQVSLAQLAFAAVGAAASARLAVEANVPWILAVLLGGLVAVPVGALVAIPAVRRSGLYLALATFGFGVLLERMVFGTSLMFGGGLGSLPAPRPSFARSEKAYFYVVLGFVIACVLLVLAVQRSRLGRLLRAMADSPLALSTYGTNVTVIKVAVFCISAFLAGLSGALLAPINGTASAGGFGAFASLLLLVVLSIAPGREVTAAFGAATALIVLPSYLTNSTLNEYLPVAFGLCAVIVATLDGGTWIPAGLARAAARTRPRSNRSPTKARLVAHSQPAHVAT
jgi:ABC-type branched-subunit amino acid transport system permease subunit